MLDDDHWHGLSMQEALLNCEVVAEIRVTDCGPKSFYFLKLGCKVIPLGISKHFANTLLFALRRNAKAFDQSSLDG